MKLLRRLIQLAALIVLVQAIRDQLGRPPEGRTWFGRVGPVPYDFRVPTIDGFLASYWNPDSQQLFSSRGRRDRLGDQLRAGAADL